MESILLFSTYRKNHFFRPYAIGGSTNPSLKLRILLVVSNYFKFWQKSIIIEEREEGPLYFKELKKLPSTPFVMVLKVISFCTVVIPLIMLVMNMVMRLAYSVSTEGRSSYQGQGPKASSNQKPKNCPGQKPKNCPGQKPKNCPGQKPKDRQICKKIIIPYQKGNCSQHFNFLREHQITQEYLMGTNIFARGRELFWKELSDDHRKQCDWNDLYGHLQLEVNKAMEHNFQNIKNRSDLVQFICACRKVQLAGFQKEGLVEREPMLKKLLDMQIIYSYKIFSNDRNEIVLEMEV